ncbi:serine/threonine dehydratase [Pseudomonas sp. 02C 26]|uniref:threonine/serine dehydratase n=1 Tax=Pseudomonas sp. 02C 26 TaxID=2054914 RepID=UPI000C6E0C85|nr:threonine/serine dehydratase [Pseudomonas sp. 02C 26]AUF94591.1 serine/threonine dehydratase [Pseudomonas sp. 02C 26]
MIDDQALGSLQQAITEAHTALRPQVAVTPMTLSSRLSALSGCEVYLKCEHLQHTGSFKYRGASNKLRLLDPVQRQRGVITASSGNHGQGLALAGQALGVPVSVYTTTQASSYKLEAMRALGAEVISLDLDPLGAELEAGRQAQLQGKPYVSPYNDYQIIAGQGTVGMELFEQQPELDAVFVAVGGGGLISGIAAALHGLSAKTRIVGCWPANSPALHASLAAGRIIEVDEEETISDGTAGGVEPDSVTLGLCQRLLSQRVLVSEAQIKAAMREVAASERWIIEGAAGVAMAGMLALAEEYRGKKVAVVLCGRNIVLEKYLEAIA